MGNAETKEFKEKELAKGLTIGDEKLVFSDSMVSKEELTLRGKSFIENGRGGYKYFQADPEKKYFSVLAHDMKGRMGTLYDIENEKVAEIRIDHHMKTDTHRCYKSKPSFDGQEAESIDGEQLYLFAKIEATRSATGSTSIYRVVTGKDTFVPLYKARRIIAPTFEALIETASANGDSEAAEEAAVGKITYLFGPRLQLQVASGVDLAAVILTGSAAAPAGACTMAALPGASFI